MAPLRDFLYLDSAMLHSFVAQIQGGLRSGVVDTARKQGGVSGGLEVGLPSIGLGAKGTISGEGGSEVQATRQLTDPAYFGELYEYLENKRLLKKLSGGNALSDRKIEIGDFVEMIGVAEPPAVDNWLSRVKAMLNFFDKNLPLIAGSSTRNQRVHQPFAAKEQMKQLKEMMAFLEDFVQLSRTDSKRKYIRVGLESGQGNAWCGTIDQYLIGHIDSILPTRVTLVGRIERTLGADEVVKLVDFSAFSGTAQVMPLLEALNKLGPLLKQRPILESDLEARYPDLFVSPIAVFR